MDPADVTNTDRPHRLELSVVVPVYNEAGTVGPVVRSWADELDRLKICYELVVYDDGSRDGTAEALREVSSHRPRVIARSHANMGHGPTISRGYREAIGEWVFQVDSDDEMPPGSFAELWAMRANYDVLLGCRKDRQSRLGRRVISGGSRAAVRLLFGRGLWDVNTPYRLIRKSALDTILPRIPAETFAPNVIIAGLAVREGLRIYQRGCPTSHDDSARAPLSAGGSGGRPSGAR